MIVGDWGMVFLIFGEDIYRGKNALMAIRERFRREKDLSGMNVVVLSANDVGVPAVHEAVLTPPFLGEKKMVILSGFLQEKKDVQEELVALMERVPECCVVVFYEALSAESLTKSVLFGFLRDQQHSKEYPMLSEREAAVFVAEEFVRHGVRASSQVCGSVVQKIGCESLWLANESKKLAMYALGVGRSEVVVDDVAVVVSGDGVDEAKVFDFTDAYVSGNVAKVLRLFRSLVAEGSHPLQLTALLLKQFRVVLVVRDAMDRGLDVPTVVAPLKLHSFVVMKSRKTAERLSMVELRSMYERVITFDLAMKSSAVDPEDALCASFVEKENVMV